LFSKIREKAKLLKRNSGSYYVETMIALALLGLMTTSLLPLLPRLLKATEKTRVRAKIVNLSEYVAEYVQRWANFSPTAKHKKIQYFVDGEELEISGEFRINRLPWAEPLVEQDDSITDHYKASITFWETVSRNNSAVVKIRVWYDTNMDNICTSSENAFSLSTIITEKRDI
jgi:type II secretory pathway pseudopilin PulG